MKFSGIYLIVALLFFIIDPHIINAQQSQINIKTLDKDISRLKTNGEVIDYYNKKLKEILNKYGKYSVEYYAVNYKYSNAFTIVYKNLFLLDTVTQLKYFYIIKDNYEISEKVYGISSFQFATSYSSYLTAIMLLSYPKSVHWDFDSLKRRYATVENILLTNIGSSELNVGELLGSNCMSFSMFYDSRFEQDSGKFYCNKALRFFERFANRSVIYPRAINKYSLYFSDPQAIEILSKYSDTIKLNFSETPLFYFQHLTYILQKMLYGVNFSLNELNILRKADSAADNVLKITSDEYLDYELSIKIPLLKKYNLTSLYRDEMYFITNDIIEENKLALNLKHYLEFCISWSDYWKSIGNESFSFEYLKMGESKIKSSENLEMTTFVDKRTIYNNLANYYRFRKIDSTFFYLFKELDLETAISEYHGNFDVMAYHEIGQLYLSLAKYKEAELYINKSINQMKGGDGLNTFYYLSDLFTLGEIHLRDKGGKEALQEMYPLINYQLNNPTFIPPISTSVYNVFGELYEQFNSDSSDKYYTEVYRLNTMLPIKMSGLTDDEQIKSLNEFNFSLQTILNCVSKRYFSNQVTKANLELASYLFSKNQQFEYQKTFKYLQTKKLISDENNKEVLRLKSIYLKNISSSVNTTDSLKLNYEYFRSTVTSEAVMANSGIQSLRNQVTNAFKNNYSALQTKLGNGECYVDIKRFMYQDKELGFSPDSITYAFLIITNKSHDTGTYYFLKNGIILDRKINANNNSGTFISNHLSELVKLLSQYSNIYINPDGIFHLINWYTLTDSDGKYLLENKTIHIVQSADDVKSDTSNIIATEKKEVVLFGDPVMQSNQEQNSIGGLLRNSYNLKGANELRSLPYTRLEVEDICDLFKQFGFTSIKYLQKNCNEENLRHVTSPAILHLATHGFYLNKLDSNNINEMKVYSSNPLLRSGLILAGSKTNDSTDNIVTAFEVLDYDLANTDLVVLSACETGKGKIEDGQGIYGLLRAFRLAGAKTVLTSLWKVDDKATRFFMKLFYTELLNGKTKVEALRNTQLQMAHNPLYSETKYWGAFTLVGE